jgi:hypothetical protein
MTRIKVEFDPLRITLPGSGPFFGEIWIGLPPVHLNVMDLSMGFELLEGAHLGADVELWGLKMDIKEPGMTTGEMVGFIESIEPQLKRAWEICDEESRKPRRTL